MHVEPDMDRQATPSSPGGSRAVRGANDEQAAGRLFEALCRIADALVRERLHPLDSSSEDAVVVADVDYLESTFGARSKELLACVAAAAAKAGPSSSAEWVRLLVRSELAGLRKVLASRIAALRRTMRELDAVLEGDFLGAEAWHRDAGRSIARKDFEGRRDAFVVDWARTHAGVVLDEAQAAAVASVHGDVHVRARAGSGKTRVMVTRAAFLHLHCRVPVERIMLVAFNRRAVEEIEKRLRTLIGAEEPLPTVATFHAVAHALADSTRQLVIDDNKTDRTLAEHVRRIVEELQEERPGVVERAIVAYLDVGCGDDDVIGSPRQGFDGTWYKSRGEVRVANWLFRRRVAYRYERRWTKTKDQYRPDFTVLGADDEPRLVIEFFGRLGDAEYDQTTSSKEAYWAKEGTEFLGLYPRDLDSDSFMAEIDLRLRRLNLLDGLMDDSEVWESFRDDRRLRDFHASVLGFVSRAQKSLWTVSRLKTEMAAHRTVSTAESQFLEIAVEVFSRFANYKAEHDIEDFDGLFGAAVDGLDRGRTILVRSKGKQRLDLRRLEYLHVDELQDISPLFQALIEAIRRASSTDLGVFGVGDDWQSINAFAGADPDLFEEFGDDAITSLTLPVNHRSSVDIVRTGNAVMSGKAGPLASQRVADQRARAIGPLAEAAAERRGLVALAEDRGNRRRFEDAKLRLGPDAGALAAIVSHALQTRGGSVMILFRQGRTGIQSGRGSYEIDALERALHRIRPGWKQCVSVQTVHQAKGREAESVIVVAPENEFPLIHPAWFLTRLLGNSIDKVLEEEQRLLYVAATRAICDLYFFTPTGKEMSAMVPERGRSIDWSDLCRVERHSIMATARLWPAEGQEHGLPGRTILGARIVRGPLDTLDPAQFDRDLGERVSRLVIRDDDGVVIHARPNCEEHVLEAPPVGLSQ